MKKNILIGLLITILLVCGIASALGQNTTLPAPAFSVTGTSFSRGELIPATLDDVEGADYYMISFSPDNGDGGWEEAVSWTGSLWLPTAPLAPGGYTVEAWAVKDSGELDENGNSIEVYGEASAKHIAVTAYTGGTGTATLRIGRTSHTSGELTMMSAYAPGAEWVSIICREDSRLDWGGSGDNWNYNIRRAPDTYTFYAEGYYADGSVVTSNNVTLTVHAAESRGVLGEPWMSLEECIPVVPGQDVDVDYSFGEETGTDGVEIIYGWTLFDQADTSGAWIYDSEELVHDGGTFVIDGSWLQPDHNYDVQLYTYAREDGFDTKYIYRSLLCVQPANVGGHDLSLTVNGSTDVECRNHDPLDLTIHAPGASAIHLYRGRSTDDWDYWGNEDGHWEDIHYSWDHWTEGTFALYLEVCYDPNFMDDENVQWYYSEPLVIRVRADGILNRPQVTVPGEVNIGELLEVQVTNLDERAEWCWADVHGLDENGDINWDDNLAHGDMFNGVIYLPTNRLEPGRSYLLSVGCSAHGILDSVNATRAFTAMGEAMDGYQFNVINTEVETGEGIAGVFNVPGAYELRIYFDGNRDDNWGFWGGNAGNFADWRIWSSGTHTFTLSARFTESGNSRDDWTDLETVEVNVSAPNGQIDLSWLSLPAQTYIGSDLTFSFSGTYVSGFNFGIWKEYRDNWGWGYGEENNTLTVPGDQLEEEGVYHYWIDLHAPGYEMTHIDRTVVAVTRQQDSRIRLTAGKTVVQCGEYFNLSVSAEGATAVSIWVADWDSHLGEGNTFSCTEQIRRPGTATVFARACYEEIDWDRVQDWHVDIPWGPISALRSITVTSVGQAAVPQVTGIPESLDWNETLHVTVGSAAHTAWYHVRIYPQDSGDELYFGDLQGPGTLDIPTYDLTPGDYRVDLYIAGEQGYAENGSSYPFHLVGLGTCGTVQATLRRASVPRGEFLEVSFPQGEHADWYHARILDEDGNEWCFVDCEHSGTHQLPTYDLEPGRTYAVRIYTGGPGYYWNETPWEDLPWFTVTEREEEVFLDFSKNTVETFERFLNSIYFPGAVQISTTVNEPEDWTPGDWDNVWQFGPWDGSETHGDGLWFENAGTYTVKLYARYEENGAWVYTGQSRTLTVTGMHYDLASLVPTVIGPGEDYLYVPPDNTEGIWANVYDDLTGEHIYWMNWGNDRESDYNYFDTDTGAWAAPEDDPMHGSNRIHIPADYLKLNHTYHIDYHFWGRGMDTYAIWDVKFSVIDGTDQGITLSVTLPDGGRNPYIHEDFTVNAHAEGATAIRIYAGENWNYYMGDTVETTLRLWDEKTYSLYAQAYYGDAPWTEEGFDFNAWNWADGTWSWENCGFAWGGVSNILEITVDRLGRVGDFDFLDHSDLSVHRRGVVKLEFTPAEHATDYWATVRRTDVESADYYSRSVSVGSTVYLCTQGMPEGEYTVYVSAYGPGYEQVDSASAVRITVTSEKLPEEPTLRIPVALDTIEEEAFDGISARIVEMGENVRTIGDRAFRNAQVEQAIVHTRTCQLGEDIFDSHVELYGALYSDIMRWAVDHGYDFYTIDDPFSD